MSAESREEWQEDEVNLLDYWRVLRKRGRMIVGLTFSCVLIAGFLSYFILVKVYESTARIIVPKESSGELERIVVGRLERSTGQLLGRLLPPTERNRDIFIAMLKSGTMARELVERFNLKERYKVAFPEDAVKALQGATEIKVSKEGVISVTVQDKDPRLAADIANAYITLLDRHSARLPGTADAGRQRAFLADELEKTEKALREAEEALRLFQENSKGLVVHEETKATILEAAKLKGQIVAAEAQLEFLGADGTKSIAHLSAQRRQIKRMRRQLAAMQQSQQTSTPLGSTIPGGSRGDFSHPSAQAQELGKESEYLRLMGGVKERETAYQLLIKQYERVKINETGDLPTFLVLDKAITAERNSKPRTTLYMAIAGVLSLFVGIFLAFFLEYLERIRKQEPGKAQAQ